MVQEFGGAPLAAFPAAEPRDNEIFVEAKVNAAGSNFIEISAYLTNKSGWPARPGDKPSFRWHPCLGHQHSGL
jgi:endoglucanase